MSRRRATHWWQRFRGMSQRMHSVGWDYVSPHCEERRKSHNATDMPKVP